ncbi:type I glyceraldehyde-3-phosphate dehydrogenase [Candidatus Dependentiae bacterium]
MIRIAINGFGRIGRNFLRAILEDPAATKKINVVAINVGPADMTKVAHMFKYDTLMGIFPGSVQMSDGTLQIDGKSISIIAEVDPEKIDWKTLDVDWVVESSGTCTERKNAEKHLIAGAKKVLISAPATGEDITIIPGVNDDKFDKNAHHIVSLGSCTTNALMPMLKVLHEAFEITNGFMTTIHAYTNAQVLLDVERKDLRRSRAAALNIIPTTTGATKVLGKIMPELDGLIGGTAIRVPVAKVSLIDLAFTAKKDFSIEAMREVFISAASGKMKNILAVSDEPLVSSDFSGNPHSVIIDLPLLDAQARVGKVFGWYDNEWAYSVRMQDFLLKIA